MPPNIAANCAMRATMRITPASVAAMALISVSRLRTWESSCASTARSSARESMRMMPSVTATAAWDGLRPVANAFGASLGTM
jgi:hypothetical protein